MVSMTQAGCDSRAPSVFSGRTALVAGGSGGIGAYVSRSLAARGATVIVHGATEAKVAALVAEIRKAGGRAEGMALKIESARQFVQALGGRRDIDILVVAFGPFVRKPLADHTVEEWESLALLDLALPGALASALFPSMRERKFGRMLFFGGTRTDSIRGYRSNAAYAAAKTGVGVLTKSLAIEGAGCGVAAVTVCPGLVKTEYLGGDAAAKLAAMAPGGELSSPELIARLALDLLDCEPCLASGAIVALDAGFSP